MVQRYLLAMECSSVFCFRASSALSFSVQVWAMRLLASRFVYFGMWLNPLLAQPAFAQNGDPSNADYWQKLEQRLGVLSPTQPGQAETKKA